MDEETLSALALAQLVELLRLALTALELVNTAEPTTLSRVSGLHDQCSELESRTVALLRHADVRWEVLAAELGVKRQSLHRRLSRKILKYMVSPEVTEGPGLAAEWDRLVTQLAATVESVSLTGPRRTSRRVARTLRNLTTG